MGVKTFNYRVHLWLYPSPKMPGGDPDFDARFPASLAKAWWNLEYSVSSDGELANKLNEQIATDCAEWLKTDFGDTIDEVACFDDGTWSSGGGGQHEGNGIIVATDPDLGTWVFGDDVTMCAAFRRVEI